MIDDTPETPAEAEKFDFSAFPQDTLFHERRLPGERRGKFATRSKTDPDPSAEASAETTAAPVAKERRARKERRRRIDPTTFEKQYTEDELEFMNAIQQFKVQSCKSFPSHGEVLQVAFSLGYRKVITALNDDATSTDHDGPPLDEPEANATIDLGIALADGAIS